MALFDLYHLNLLLFPCVCVLKILSILKKMILKKIKERKCKRMKKEMREKDSNINMRQKKMEIKEITSY